MKQLLLLLTFLLLTSCEIDYTNPWDASFPPEKPISIVDSLKCQISNTTATINWGDVEMETAYIVEKQIDNGTWQQIADLPADSKSFSDTGISYNSKLTYRVKGYNPEKDKPYSEYEYFNFYTISGKITTTDNQPMADAQILGLPYILNTNAYGDYCALLPKSWSGSFKIKKTGFSSTAIMIPKMDKNQTQDITAYADLAISGKITDSDNIGISGVVINAANGIIDTTDASGNYSLSVPYNWSGTATISKTGYTFDPANKSYTNITTSKIDENYIASINMFTISGKIGTISGVTMSGFPSSIVTDATGNYTTSVPYNWSGTITPSKTGFTFNPTTKNYANTTTNKPNENYTASINMFTIS